MQRLRIYLYTGGFTHTLYREQVRATPDDVTLLASSPELFGTEIKSDLKSRVDVTSRVVAAGKRQTLRILTSVGVPNIRYLSVPDCDLVHSAQYGLVNRRPWVVDFEDASVFAWYHPKAIRTARVRYLLQRLFESRFCRRILPWTEAAQDSLRNLLRSDEVDHKLKVVYPAIAPRVRAARHDTNDEVRLLFVGSAFYMKGGLETLIAYRRLLPRYRLQLHVVSLVPAEVIREFGGLKGLTFHSRIPPSELTRLYLDSDILIAPLHTDTFGFVLLEAFAHGLPCVVTDQFAAREIVTDGVTGVVIANHVSRFGADRLPVYSVHGASASAIIGRILRPPEPYLDALTSAIERLVGDHGMRTRMADAAYAEVCNGRFSLNRRKTTMSALYRDAHECAA